MEIKVGYQRTEAGVLPVAWQAAMLGDHVKITSGISPSLLNFKADGVPYFKVEQLSNSVKYLDAKSTPYHFQTGPTVQAGSVIFAKRGAAIALNKIRILSEESFMDTNLMSLTPSTALDVDYLFYGLGFIGLWRFADTTSVPQINNKHIKPLAFPLPEIQEQKAIATSLSDVDALIAGLEKLIAKKRDLKQAAMQQLLTGQTRLPGFSGEWKYLSLGELCSLKSGTSITSSGISDQGAYRCFGGNGLRGYTPTFTHNGSHALIGRQGALCGNVVGVQGKFFASEHALVVTPRIGVAIEWLTFVLGRMNLNQYSESSAQPGLSAFKLLILEVLTPPSEAEQAAIAEALAFFDAELTALESRLTKTRDLKQGMMQELLTGRTRLV